MAVTHALITTGSDTTQATSYTTASTTPVTGRLMLLSVTNSKGSTPDTPTVSGASVTWVQVGTTTNNGATIRSTLFRAMGSGSAQALTISFGANTQTGCAWILTEYDNVDTGGTNGSGAVVQSVTNFGVASLNPNATLAAFSSASNATYATSGHAGNKTYTAGSGFGNLQQVTYASPSVAVATEFRADNDTTADFTITTNDDWTCIAVEIAAPTVAWTGPVYRAEAHGSITTGTQLTVNKPTGTAALDWLVIFVTCRASESAVSSPTGTWKNIFAGAADTGAPGGATDVKLYIWYRIATASEAANYTIDFTASTVAAAVVGAYSGADPDVGQDGGGQGNGASSTTQTLSTFSTSKAMTLVVGAVTSKLDTTYTPPSGSTERADFNTSTGALALELMDKQQATAGAVGTLTWTAAGAALWSTTAIGVPAAVPRVKDVWGPTPI